MIGDNPQCKDCGHYIENLQENGCGRCDLPTEFQCGSCSQCRLIKNNAITETQVNPPNCEFFISKFLNLNYSGK